MGEGQVYRQQDHQRQIRDGVGKTSIKAICPVSTLCVPSSRFYGWNHEWDGKAAMVHPAQRRIAHGVRGSVE